MDSNKFTQIMANAQRLMLDENFNRAVDAKIAAQSGNGGFVEPNLSSMEQQAFGYSQMNESKPIQIIQAPQQAQTQPNLNKLPKALRESFMKTPPLSGDGTDSTPMGVLESTLSLKEQQMPTQQQRPVQIPNGGAIDYSLIKSIIDESVRTQIAEIKKSIISESTLKGMKLGNGNKIQMIDKAGNLYEATLTLKKKASK